MHILKMSLHIFLLHLCITENAFDKIIAIVTAAIIITVIAVVTTGIVEYWHVVKQCHLNEHSLRKGKKIEKNTRCY